MLSKTTWAEHKEAETYMRYPQTPVTKDVKEILKAARMEDAQPTGKQRWENSEQLIR